MHACVGSGSISVIVRLSSCLHLEENFQKSIIAVGFQKLLTYLLQFLFGGIRCDKFGFVIKINVQKGYNEDTFQCNQCKNILKYCL
jgi:hypothetical protein